MIDNLFDVDCDNVHMVKIDEYEAAPTPKPNVPMATDKQLDFLKRLFNERRNNEEAMIVRTHLLEEYKAGKLTRMMASDAISDILMIEKDQKSPAHLTQSLNLEHGQVWVNTDNQFVKIALNQQGTHFYGKLWDAETMPWSYNPHSMSNLDHLVTAEEAKEFSLQWESEHRYCIFCMKHLSDPRSETAGYGQTCAENHNLPWG